MLLRSDDPALGCRALEAQLRALGKSCELEPGAAGLLVYASTRVDVVGIARMIQSAAVEKDPRATVTGPEYDPEEPHQSAWWAEVSFDWRRL